jgi:hypothetical protein
MHLLYGTADGNGREAICLYTEKFLKHQQLHNSTFTATDGQLCETNSLRPIVHNMGCQRTAGTPNVEEEILCHWLSIHQYIFTGMYCACESFNSLADEQPFYPYHLQCKPQ